MLEIESYTSQLEKDSPEIGVVFIKYEKGGTDQSPEDIMKEEGDILQEKLGILAELGINQIIVSLAEVSELSSEIKRQLFTIHRQLRRETQGSILLADLNDQLRSDLETAGLLQVVFHSYFTTEQAIKSLQNQ